jgi:protein-tyrosine-phosphatase
VLRPRVSSTNARASSALESGEIGIWGIWRLIYITVLLFGHFDGKNRKEIVDDPYYGGKEGFQENFEQVTRFSKNFVREVLGVEVA